MSSSFGCVIIYSMSKGIDRGGIRSSQQDLAFHDIDCCTYYIFANCKGIMCPSAKDISELHLASACMIVHLYDAWHTLHMYSS